MRSRAMAVSAALGSLGVLCTAIGAAETLFTTSDYRQDREQWTDPAYYRHNTARQLTDMQVENRYGEEGSGANEYTITSPYDYETSWEHYQAWLKEAGGGTKHTLETLPNWDGLWTVRRNWLDSRRVQAATIAAALTPRYREYYVQQVKAESEGRHWWPAAFCLPDGFVRGVWRGPKEFVVRPQKVWIISSMLAETQIRWVHTDGRNHPPEALQYPRWQGESIGFWNGDALVVHTNQIRQWNTTHSMFEWSDRMSAVERYERIGDTIVGEITFYDPTAFLEPLHAKLTFDLVEADSGVSMSYDTCTDTNGPSSNVYVDEGGFLDERVPGDPGYWDPTDPRPWAAHYMLGE
jgi:hypothetical protein